VAGARAKPAMGTNHETRRVGIRYIARQYAENLVDPPRVGSRSPSTAGSLQPPQLVVRIGSPHVGGVSRCITSTGSDLTVRSTSLRVVGHRHR
jgi:hypothetical protein